MIKTTFTLLFCWCSFLGICSGPVDTTLFTSEFEQSLFTRILQSGKLDSVDMFIAINYTKTDVQNTIDDYTKKLMVKVSESPDSRRIKTIYKEVHDKFLSKYEQEAYFNDIFSNGNYNCVTASALFAIIFDELGIPYVIKQKPDHVYLIADPAKTGYLVETTLPGEKIVQFDDRYKMHYLEYLHNNKIISDREFDSESVDGLFEKYYTNDKTITLRDLAGLHYYNKGVFEYNKSLFTRSYADLEKAFLLNHDKMISFMRNNALLSILNAENQKKTFNGYYLAKYIASNDSNNMGIQFGKDYFDAVSAELVINHPNIDAYKKYFAEFLTHIDDHDITDFIQRHYFYLAYSSAVNYRYSEALSYLKVSYEKNPENINTRQLISECVAKYLINDRNHNMAIDSLTAYIDRFPFLMKDKNTLSYLEYCYAKTIESSYMYDEGDAAAKRMKDYELFIKINPDHDYNKEFVKIMYQQQAFYQIRKGNPDLAEQTLRKGIRRLPQSDELKGMLRSVMESKGARYEYPELMSDSKPLKKYLLGAAIAKDNMEEINENAGKYLGGSWQITNMIDLGVEMEAPEALKMRISLMNDHKAEVFTDNKQALGTWKYNPAKCILDIHVNQKDMHIIINQIGPEKIRGVFYEKTDYENAKDVILTVFRP